MVGMSGAIFDDLCKPTARPAMSQRDEVMATCNGLCVKCGAPAEEVDHRIPRGAFGSDSVENLFGICRICHKEKTSTDVARLRIEDLNVFTSRFSDCLLYTSPSPRDRQKSRMPSSA